MLAVAAVETLVTFAGIVLVGFTLYHTKRAADAAHAAVNEAKAAREVNRDIGEAQTRAYVKIDWAAFSLDTRGGPTSIYPVIRIEATNSGNSPAAAFRWNVRAMYTHSQGFSGTIYQNHIRHPESWGIALASRDTVGQYEPCRYAYLRDEQKAEIGHLPGVDAYFEIEIVYTDVFEKEFSIISVFGGSIGSLSQGEQRLKRLPHTLEEISRKHIEMY